MMPEKNTNAYASEDNSFRNTMASPNRQNDDN